MLNLYLLSDPSCHRDPRLVVARTLDQALAMSHVGDMVTKATVFQAYRLAKCGVELEYSKPTYEGQTR